MFNDCEIKLLAGRNHQARPIILLHGTASCSVKLFFPILKMLQDNSSVIYFVNYNTDDIHTLFTKLHQVIPPYHSNPILIGHSFGSFLALKMALTYESFFSKVIAISPVGLFPFLGKYGAWWGLFFKLGFPTNVINLFNKKKINHLVKKYITITCTGVYWNDYLAHKLLAKNNLLDISFVFGTSDTITPKETGLMLCPQKTYIVPESGHNPIENSEQILLEIITTPSCPSTFLEIDDNDLRSKKITSFNIFSF